MNSHSMIEFLSDWFGVYAGREAYSQPMKTRIFLDSTDHFTQYCEDCFKLKVPCYLSVNHYSARNQLSHLERLFFDFDYEAEPQKAFKEASVFYRVLTINYHVKPLLAFSGKKGYHVYVWFKNVIEGQDQQLKRVYDKTQQKLLSGLKYDTLDKQVIGDVKRLARVPYSTHEKSGNLCQPVNSENGEPIQVEDLALDDYRFHGFSNDFVKGICLDVKQDQEKKLKLNRKPYLHHIKNRQLRPCLTHALQSDLQENNGHNIRIAIAVEAKAAGYTIDETVELFRSQSDFGNGEKSWKYVNYLFEREDTQPFSCFNIKRYGYCLASTCPLYKKKLVCHICRKQPAIGTALDSYGKLPPVKYCENCKNKLPWGFNAVE